MFNWLSQLTGVLRDRLFFAKQTSISSTESARTYNVQMNKVFINPRNFDMLEISKVIKVKWDLRHLFYEGKPRPIQNSLKPSSRLKPPIASFALKTSLVLCSRVHLNS